MDRDSPPKVWGVWENPIKKVLKQYLWVNKITNGVSLLVFLEYMGVNAFVGG